MGWEKLAVCPEKGTAAQGAGNFSVPIEKLVAVFDGGQPVEMEEEAPAFIWGEVL